MKSIIHLIVLLSSSMSLAKTQIHEGSYEVPRDDGKIVDFPSSVQFEGSSLAEASEFTVTFPVQLTGIENTFVIKKVKDQWEGNPELFEEVTCTSDEFVYDFSCRLKFKKDKVIDVTDIDENSILHLIPSLPTPQLTADFESKDPATLFVDKNLAVEAMQLASLSAASIGEKQKSIDIFLSEPIGFFKYRVMAY